MATFNAGAIEATLDLDVDPFQRGIDKARAEGRKFAGEKFTAKLEVDDREAKSELTVMRREFERVAQRYTAHIEVNGTAAASREIGTLEAQLAALDDRTVLDIDTDATTAGFQKMRGGIKGLIAPLAILATGLVPLSAAAVPVLGLANNLTLAGAGIGSVALAVMTTLPAFKAVNKAGLEPTAENLEAMRVALDKLNPNAREFIDVVQGLGPGASALRNAAQAGFFPSINDALSQVDLRDYQGLVFELADTMGDLGGKTITALSNPRWTEFFGFVKSEARPGIDALGQSVGNLAGFFASLWQAFDPVNDDFSAWMVDATGRARDWADSLEGSPEFEDFLAYVRQQGPEAAETLKSLGGAFLDVVEAAAPLGGVVLDVLQGVGEAVSFIADQPFGDELLMGAAALWTLNKALTATSGLMTRMGMTGMAGAGAARGGMAGTGMFAGFGSNLRTAVTPMTAAQRAMVKPGQISEQAKAASQLRMQAAGAAAAVGAIALMSTGAGEAIGISNTAMLGLAGSMAGPFGAAAGATVGLMLDLRAASNEGADAVKSFNSAVANVSSVSEYKGALDQLNQSMQDRSFLAKHGFELESAGVFGLGGSAFAAITGDKDAQAERDAAAAAGDYADLETAARGLADAQGMVGVTTEDLDNALRGAQPAMNALNITTDDLIAAADNGTLDSLTGQIEAWQRHADSAAGRTEAFADSVADLANDAMSTADSASQMQAALEALLSPTLNLEQATDDWRTALKTLEHDLKAGAGFAGFNKAAMENRQITRDYVTSSMERLGKLAEVGTTTEEDMANAVAQTRREFIQSGMAAGFSRKEITARADAMGLTPKMVNTIFHAAGISETDLKARQLRDVYRSLPKRVQTALKADGIPETKADVDSLVEKYHLTEKQRTALINLKDLATKDLVNILAKLGLVDRNVSTPQIVLNGAEAVGNSLAGISSWLTNLNGRTATTWVTTRHVNDYGPGPRHGADGSTVPKTAFGYADRWPYLLADGEEVVSNRHGQADAWRPLLKAISAGTLADGGTAGRLTARQVAALAGPGGAGGRGPLAGTDVDRIVAAIEANRGVFAHVSSREDLETAMRAIDRELRR